MEYNTDLKVCAETCTNFISGEDIKPCRITGGGNTIRCAYGLNDDLRNTSQKSPHIPEFIKYKKIF